MEKLKWVKALPHAIPPSKKPEDVGYDLSVIKVVSHINDVTILFDTGIKVSPPPGYYIEIIPRSSLSKSGFVLTNSVGVIDPTYTGNILVSLTKIDKDAKIKLPFRCVQMVVRKFISLDLEEVGSLEETERGDGGFGSTGI